LTDQINKTCFGRTSQRSIFSN